MRKYIKTLFVWAVMVIISEPMVAQSDNLEDRGWDIIREINPAAVISSSPQSQIFEKYVKVSTG